LGAKGWQLVLLLELENEAYGDQCEKCGSTLNATDLINPKSITGETPIMKSTKHWFYLWIVMKIS
jgi:methionyl-tRNA synthetase